MVGIEVGARGVRRSHGAPMAIAADAAPGDLLHRVSTGAPWVRVDDDEPQLRSIEEVYADVVAASLEDDGEGDGDERTPVAIAVPGWWPPDVVDGIADALHARSIDAVLVNDAEAAVEQARSEGIALPDVVAVLALRSTHASVVVVRDCTTRPRARLSPTPVLEEGGDMLDVAVLQHLLRGLEALGEDVDRSEPDVVAAAREALDGCRIAREALSTTVAHALRSEPFGTTRRIRLLRSELEEIATGWTDAVVDLVRTALEQSPDEARTILLTGGLASMPVVSQRLSADLGVETLVPTDPQGTSVHGAERMLERMLRETTVSPWQRMRRMVRGAVRGGARRAPRRSSDA